LFSLIRRRFAANKAGGGRIVLRRDLSRRVHVCFLTMSLVV
jgi:hypothetical protein